MSHDTPSVREWAARRHQTAQQSLKLMRFDLVIAANRALQVIHSQTEVPPSTIPGYIPRDDAMWVGSVAEDGGVNLYPIPDTTYRLPDWQQEVAGRRFFDMSLEHTLVNDMPNGRRALVSFEQFVRDCPEHVYVAVCEGLDLLANPGDDGAPD